MDSKELNKLYSRLSEKQTMIKQNIDYASGRNPYIINKAETKKPDNRMPVTLGKMAIDAMAGYAGKAGNIKVYYDLVSTDEPDPNDPFIMYMDEMDKYNETDLEISELYEGVLLQGYAYEIFWVSDKNDYPGGLLTTEYKIVPSNEMVLVYTRELKPQLSHAVRFTKDSEYEYATVYAPYLNQEFQRKAGESWVLVDEIITPFEMVPVNVYKANKECKSLFEAEKAFIDGIDEIISKSMNEVDRFNAAIALFGNKLGSEMAKEFINSNIAIIDGLVEDTDNPFTPQYMEKNLSGVKDFYSELIDRMEQWFRKSVGIADFSDEAFAGQQSGIAILFKLIPMEFRAAQIETYFNQGLKKRLDYYADVYNLSSKTVDVRDYTTIIKSERNIPVDEKSKVEVLEKLQGMISRETLLEAIPNTIVSDAKKELERLDGESVIDIIGSMEEEEDSMNGES